MEIKNKAKYIQDAPFIESQNILTSDDLRNLKEGNKIKARDDSFSRLAYLTIQSDCLVPGNEYTIEEIAIYGHEGSIKVKEHQSYFGIKWFEKPNLSLKDRVANAFTRNL